ncbi:MAG TPA: hypothetical protein DC054_11325 [Blastocatellia bacterium]|nr:hypothetical protein [Blastocatellia bacterium]
MSADCDVHRTSRHDFVCEKPEMRRRFSWSSQEKAATDSIAANLECGGGVRARAARVECLDAAFL